MFKNYSKHPLTTLTMTFTKLRVLRSRDTLSTLRALMTLNARRDFRLTVDETTFD